MKQASQILEITFTLILVYLILSQSRAFAETVGAIGQVYVNAVRTLQGR